MINTAASPIKIYRPSPIKRSLLFVLGGLCLLVPLLLPVIEESLFGREATGTASESFAFTLWWFILGGWTICHAIRCQLVISSEGIELRGIFTTTHIPWKAIDRIGFHAVSDSYVLILNKNALPKTNAILYYISTGGMSRSVLSLTDFMWQWGAGMRQDVRQYAPHLFSDDHLQSTSSK